MTTAQSNSINQISSAKQMNLLKGRAVIKISDINIITCQSCRLKTKQLKQKKWHLNYPKIRDKYMEALKDHMLIMQIIFKCLPLLDPHVFGLQLWNLHAVLLKFWHAFSCDSTGHHSFSKFIAELKLTQIISYLLEYFYRFL